MRLGIYCRISGCRADLRKVTRLSTYSNFRRKPSRLYQLYGPVAAESLLARKPSKFVVGIQN